MTSFQLGLIVAGAALVAGVVIYNWLQERRVRRNIEAAFQKAGPAGEPRLDDAQGSGAGMSGRIEPTLAGANEPGPAATAAPENAPRPVGHGDEDEDAAYEPPLDIQARIASDFTSGPGEVLSPATAPEAKAAMVPALGVAMPTRAEKGAPQPDPDIECQVLLQPVRPVTAGAIAAGLHARLGKPLRWFGRRGAGLPWQLLKSDTVGEFTEITACLLLADRSGAASEPLLDAFARLAGNVASSLPAAFVPPDTAREAARAETLDRICADLDVQIGLTVLKVGPVTIQGTRLRGVAEAAGFRLADGGRFDWVQEETGAVLYSLQNYRTEPFTADALRVASTPGAVFLLDVPRVAEPVRVFDQMKLAARRMAQTLEATLVDDNRRPLDDAALTAIRQQVHATAAALRELNIEPGSPRALALFGS
jgi:hypothetical protein